MYSKERNKNVNDVLKHPLRPSPCQTPAAIARPPAKARQPTMPGNRLYIHFSSFSFLSNLLRKKTCALCSGQGFAACPTQRAHRLLFQNILYHHRLAISANRASTSSLRVAQLVQNRTAVCSASGLAVRVMAYFSLRALYQLLGRMGNCWLVGESNSMAQPLLQTQRGCAWPGGPP